MSLEEPDVHYVHTTTRGRGRKAKHHTEDVTKDTDVDTIIVEVVDAIYTITTKITHTAITVRVRMKFTIVQRITNIVELVDRKATTHGRASVLQVKEISVVVTATMVVDVVTIVTEVILWTLKMNQTIVM
jgi:hypothetical protein